MTTRLFVLSLCLLAASLGLRAVSKSEFVPMRQPFDMFPMELDGWKGQRMADFDKRVLTILGVDEYITRVYARAGDNPLHLYVGYYESQRQGDTIHSPMNCLPGAGWEPVRSGRVRISVPASTAAAAPTPIEVNRVMIQKGIDRQLVLYWYQGHGRVVASEYWGRIFLVTDAIRLNRTDGALVRIMRPVRDGSKEAEAEADQAVTSFAQSLFPRLRSFLPS